MTIMELGALGEFFGAVVVFITLIYLALQVRHARSELRTSVQNARLQGVRDQWLARLQNPELVDAMIKVERASNSTFLQRGFVGALIDQMGLTPREAYLIFCDQVVNWQNWIAAINNLDDQSPDSLARMNASIERSYTESYGKLFWDYQRAANVEKNAVRYIKKLLANSSDTPLDGLKTEPKASSPGFR